MLPVVLDRLFKCGKNRNSRNGPVLQLEGPTILCYEHPWERVMFWPERDANPFFHMFEAMWMLAGRDDVASLAKYVPRMAEYSDDGQTFHGAYGHRWRKAYAHDQLLKIADRLAEDPDDRRQVLSMWDVELDLHEQKGVKDLPCNTHAYFAVSPSGCLDLTVCNRSNDVVWGALGANCVHMSFLLEYMSHRTGIPMGKYYQISNNLHGYLTTLEPLRGLVRHQGANSPYTTDEVSRVEFREHDANIAAYVDGDPLTNRSGFLGQVAVVMDQAYFIRKSHGLEAAIKVAQGIVAADWRKACVEWLERRLIKQQRAQDDGPSHESNQTA